MQIALLAAILLIAAVLRLWRLGAISFTYDAAAVSNLAAHIVDTGQVPLQGMVSSAGMRNPALGVWLISLPALFSRDPVVLAGFVALLNVAAVYGTYWLGSRYWSVGVGLLAALLFAVSPWAVQHSRGILGQDLLIPGVVLLLVFLFRWFVDGRQWALTAGIVTALALIQIHLAALAFLPLLAILIAWQIIAGLRRRQGIAFWRYALLGVILGALLYVPYLIAEIDNGWENIRLLLAVTDQPYRFYRQAPDLALMAVGGRNIHSLAGPEAHQAYMAGLIDRTYRLDRLEEWLVVLATIYLAVGWFGRRNKQQSAKRDSLLLLWLVVPLLFFMVSKSELYPHYLVVIYPAPYLALSAALQGAFATLANRRRLRTGLAIVTGALLGTIVLWQMYLVVTIYRFIDLTDTPEGWGTPVRILQEVMRTTQQVAGLNEQTAILMLCSGSDPRWDECPAVFSFLASRGPQIDFLDYNDPAFRIHQDDTQTLVVLAPGTSLAAVELPHLAQELPDVRVPLREDQGAYRFFRFHDPYQDIAAYLQAVAQPDDAILLIGSGQREDLARHYQGSLPIIELPQSPADPGATVEELAQLTSQYRRLYGLYRASEASDPQGSVDNWLRNHTSASADRWLGPVRVVTYAPLHSTDGWLANEADANFSGQIQLRKLAQSAEIVEAGDMLQLRLDWQALVQPAANYSLFVQLLDQTGRVQAQRDLLLVDEGLPTSAWQVGQEGASLLGLDIPVGTPPGTYHLIFGLYNAADGNRLAVGQADYLDLGTFTVERSSRSGAIALSGVRFRPNVAFSEVTLAGYDRYKDGFAHAPDTPLSPGDTLRLIFEWFADSQPTQSWTVVVRLLDRDKNPVGSINVPLVSDHYPSSQWEAGESVRAEHLLPVPAMLAPGRYQLQLGISGQNQQTPSRWVDMGPIIITEAGGT